LQIEIEQIDAEHLAGLPDARLRHYSEVLREQVEALQAQAFECAAPILLELGLPPQMTEPRVADAALTRLVAEARHAERDIERDLRALDDPGERRALLDALAQEEGDDFESIDAVLQALMHGGITPPAPARPQQQRKKHGGKKRRR
jgi:hypothetical protein